VSREISRSDHRNWNRGQSGREFLSSSNAWMMAVVVWTLAHDVLKCSPLPLNGLQRYRTQPPTLPGIAEPEIIETTIDL
jgi:hypothetical protein